MPFGLTSSQSCDWHMYYMPNPSYSREKEEAAQEDDDDDEDEDENEVEGAESGIYSLSSCSSYIPQRQFRFQGFMSELLRRWGFNFVLGRSRVAVTWAKVVVFALMLLLLRVVPLSGSPRAPNPTLVGIPPVRVLYSSRRRQSSLTTSVGNPWNESPEAPAQLLLPRRVAIVWRNFAATGTDGDVAMAMWRIQRSIDPVV